MGRIKPLLNSNKEDKIQLNIRNMQNLYEEVLKILMETPRVH
jgi:hypothetical protein